MENLDKTYRNLISKKNFISFQAKVKETDLFISSDSPCKEETLQSIYKHRYFIEEYIDRNPLFLKSLYPIRQDSFAPPIIREMISAGIAAGTGPMASVAGAMAQYVGNDLLEYSPNIIIENGGDIFTKLMDKDVTIGIFAGKSNLSYKVGLKIRKENTPLGICTSSGTVGHSLSFGNADAVCVVSRSAALADAAATSICNMIRSEKDISKAIDFGSHIDNVLGILIIIGESLGVWGELELI